MLTRFEVKGFKSLVDVSIDLGAVNIFIGANGSGKSNLLEAIGLLGAFVSGGPIFEACRYRGVRAGSPDSFICQIEFNARSKIFLRATDPRTRYQTELYSIFDREWATSDEIVEFDGQEIVRSLESEVLIKKGSRTKRLPISTSPSSSTIRQFVPLYFSLNKNLYQPNNSKLGFEFLSADFFDRLHNFAIFTPNTSQLRGLQDDIHRVPLGLGGSDLAKAIEEMSQTDPTMIGPFSIDDITELIEWADAISTNSVDRSADSPVHLRLGDRYMRDGRNAISALEASEGSLYVLFLLALVGHERSPRMFAVDNFDQALHPRLARELTEVICTQLLLDGTRQMFATTHNPLVLDGLDLLDDRIRLFGPVDVVNGS